MSVITLSINKRELDLIIDAVVVRNEGLEDIKTFSINPLAVQLRIDELNRFIEELRILRDLNNGKV